MHGDHVLKEQLKAMMREYGKAWDRCDLDAVTRAYRTPCFVVDGGRVTVLSSDEEKRALFAPRLSTPAENGYDRTEIRACDVRLLGSHSAFVSVNWVCLGEGGEAVLDFWHTYHAVGNAGDWKLLSDTRHG